MNIKKPSPENYPSFYKSYIDLVPDQIEPFLENQWHEIKTFILNTTKNKLDYRYEPEKWTIAEVFGHIIDVEKVMGYRLLAFSRKDENSIPGFSEDNYVQNSVYNEMNKEDIAEWWKHERGANLKMLNAINQDAFEFMGNANGSPIKTSALPYILAGHVQHHVNILKNRYKI
ncbi:DinB family protein [Mangrovivirga cuniculi]|uniref:DNA damage-inducible protein DinB n=1 Tax=Mangrovivirga cuniculi TaxID=2715131 RepID=A0A4D7JIZ9_9BACT|nr:DinB family protein [Mangrovivirga cuniculi]QCK14963.1 DNA damage-inducible protein DinB [Mangrovivirga cuniculi]